MYFRILDLFCGAGGLSCGLDSLEHFKTVIGVDFDSSALNTFKKNIKSSYVVCGDLTNKKIKKQIISLAKKEKVNMIVGGPPCQGFSLKGKKMGLNDPRNFLFLEYLDLVKKIQPEVFVIENVKNLVNACDGYFINQILNKLKKIGYIVNFGILDAQNFGVPQHRERTIIIGSKTKSIPLPLGNVKKVTVQEAISDLSYLNSGEGKFETKYKYKPKSEYQKMLRSGCNFLYNHIATSHSKIALKKLSFIPRESDKRYLPVKYRGKQKFSCTWSRLVWDSISPTIDTRFDTPSNGRNSHPELNRSITPREAARLQSFPDKFIFFGKKCSVCKQIGNAVPPLLAKAIGQVIYNAYQQRELKIDNQILFNNDANLVVKELIAKGIKADAIITDPPYNISKKNNLGTLRHRKGVDFGEWDKQFDVTFWIDDYSKILNKNGSIIVFCSYLYLSKICQAFKKNSIDVKDVIVWKKTNPMPRNTQRRYVQDMEFAIWGVKNGAKWIFNKPDSIPYLRSLFETSTVSGKERVDHPTQKSLKLFINLISIHTNKNNLVIDPFMGSGTTGVACRRLGRKFIGIELKKKYFNIAVKRIKDSK